MRHFIHLSDKEIDEVFFLPPQEFNSKSDKDKLRFGMGGCLYMPATKYIAPYLLGNHYTHLTSYMLCFQNFLRPHEVAVGHKTVFNILRTLQLAEKEHKISLSDLPLLFVQVRDVEHFEQFTEFIRPYSELLRYMTGIAMPNISSENGQAYFEIFRSLKENHRYLYAVPILSSERVLSVVTRVQELVTLKNLFEENIDHILNIRISSNQMFSYSNIRRPVIASYYDMACASHYLSDVLNILSPLLRKDATLSAPLWEYYNPDYRYPHHKPADMDLFKILFGEPFTGDQAMDGLIREILLDRTNGFVGKNVVHPYHVSIINAMHAITFEEYENAQNVFNGGRFSYTFSPVGNRQIHNAFSYEAWAETVLKLSQVFGVLNEQSTYSALF